MRASSRTGSSGGASTSSSTSRRPTKNWRSSASKFPRSRNASQTVVAAVQRIRGLELRKAPSVSESLDWARSLVILNAESLDRELVESTLTMLVKHEKDLERVKGALDKVLADLD